MPTYEYECTACGHPFETVQSMKDPHLTDCPKAGCPGPVRRKIGRGAGIIFKGSGFYQTDYRSESYKAAAKKESGGGESGGGGDSGASVAAPAPSTAAAGASSGSSAAPPPAAPSTASTGKAA